MGADKGIHVNDDAIHGSDAPRPRWCSPKAIEKAADGPDLVVTGMASTDGTWASSRRCSPSASACRQVTFASELTVGTAPVTPPRRRRRQPRRSRPRCRPCVSVTDQINEPRYPSFKGIMAAKKKPVETWTLADLGVDAGEVGLDAAWTKVLLAKRPPREQGEIVKDEGDGGTKLAEFLAARKFL
jgi:electron transfer flavoprotein beta subunit